MGRRVCTHVDFEVVLPSGQAEELLTLLQGYETLLRWGDVSAEQLTLALHDGRLGEDGSELQLAAQVHRIVQLLKEQLEEPAEAKPAEGRISNESPVGRALLGKKKGENVTVSVPAGDIDYKIVSIT